MQHPAPVATSSVLKVAHVPQKINWYCCELAQDSLKCPLILLVARTSQAMTYSGLSF